MWQGTIPRSKLRSPSFCMEVILDCLYCLLLLSVFSTVVTPGCEVFKWCWTQHTCPLWRAPCSTTKVPVRSSLRPTGQMKVICHPIYRSVTEFPRCRAFWLIRWTDAMIFLRKKNAFNCPSHNRRACRVKALVPVPDPEVSVQYNNGIATDILRHLLLVLLMNAPLWCSVA
jgi:hypothetical protein